jgi:hypothetical protein
MRRVCWGEGLVETVWIEVGKTMYRKSTRQVGHSE